MIRKIKNFLKKNFPKKTRLYHAVRLILKSFFAHPFRQYVYVADTNIKIPIHNPHVYGLSIGGGRLVQNRLYYEEHLVGIAKKMIREGKGVFFDVGAHIGYWSYVAASWGMQVAAFETNEAAADVIIETKGRHNLPITVWPTGDNLDAFVQETGLVPNFIKIDVDGNEAHVISGAKNILQTHTPSLMIEVREETMGLVDELKQFGYKEVKRLGDDSVCVFLEKP